MERTVYRFDEVEVDSSRGCLSFRGEERHLRQKAYQVLIYLLERKEQLVSKGELFETVWPNTSVTDDVLVQCVKEIRRAIEDDPHKPRYIKTVPKSGYRFIGEVSRESRNGSNGHVPKTVAIQPPADALPIPRPFLRWGLSFVLTVGMLLTLGLYFEWPQGFFAREKYRLPADARKTIAVIAMENRSGNAELDWLREGLADMLVVGLSRSERLSLVDRGRLHELAGRLNAKGGVLTQENGLEIARLAHADVFVLGSFAQLGDRFRVDTHLHSGQTGELLSSESLTVDKAERILTEIDLLSLKIANRLKAGTSEKRELTSVTTDNLEAYRYYSLAVEKAHGFQNREAIDLLERAVELDPDFAMAHARIGYTYAVTWGRADEGKPYLEKAFGLSSRLTEKERLNIAAWYAIANRDYSAAIASYRQIIARFSLEIEAYWRLARLLGGEEQHDEAIAVLKQGLTIDPQSDKIHNILGMLLSGRGRHEEAIAAHERYVALAPNEPNAYDSLGLSYQWSGNYDRAIELFERALTIDPNFDIAQIHLANARIRLGQYNAAVELVRRYIAGAPSANERARGYDCLAFLYLRKGQRRLAEQAASNAVSANPESAWQAYVVAVHRRQKAKAAELEKRVLEPLTYVERGSRPNSRFEPYYKAVIALNHRRSEEAIGLFREVVRYAPPTWSFVDFEDSLGAAFLDLKRYDEAIEEFERVLRIAPNYPLAHFHLAEAYRAKGLHEEARTNYLKFLEDWKNADADLPEIVRARDRGRLVRGPFTPAF